MPTCGTLRWALPSITAMLHWKKIVHWPGWSVLGRSPERAYVRQSGLSDALQAERLHKHWGNMQQRRDRPIDKFLCYEWEKGCFGIWIYHWFFSFSILFVISLVALWPGASKAWGNLITYLLEVRDWHINNGAKLVLFLFQKKRKTP